MGNTKRTSLPCPQDLRFSLIGQLGVSVKISASSDLIISIFFKNKEKNQTFFSNIKTWQS